MNCKHVRAAAAALEAMEGQLELRTKAAYSENLQCLANDILPRLGKDAEEDGIEALREIADKYAHRAIERHREHAAMNGLNVTDPEMADMEAGYRNRAEERKRHTGGTGAVKFIKLLDVPQYYGQLQMEG